MGNTRWPADRGPKTGGAIYTRGNIGEVAPNVSLPLEQEVVSEYSEVGWQECMKIIGMATDKDFGADRVPNGWATMGIFGGYFYFNVSMMRLLGVRMPGMSPELIDKQFLGEAEGIEPYSPKKGDKSIGATLRLLRTVMSTLGAKKVDRLDQMRSMVASIEAKNPGLDASDEDLLKFIEYAYKTGYCSTITDHVVITMQATIASGAFADMCEKKLGDPSLALSLTTGLGDVVTTRFSRAMWDLANNTPADQYDAKFAAFLDEFGHRGPDEFSMFGRVWALYPEVAQAAIDKMRGLGAEHDPALRAQSTKTKRDEALGAVKAKISKRLQKQLDKSIASVALWSRAREEAKDLVIQGIRPARAAFLELVRRGAERGGTSDPKEVGYLTYSEFLQYLKTPADLMQTIAERKVQYEDLCALEPPFAFDSKDYAEGYPPLDTWAKRKTADSPKAAQAEAGQKMVAAAGAPGKATGRARIILDPSDPGAMEPGDVLITRITDPAWTPLFIGASAVIVEVGAAMSHAMIVSRELGIPCVVGLDDATETIPDGAMIEVDGTSGTVTLQ